MSVIDPDQPVDLAASSALGILDDRERRQFDEALRAPGSDPRLHQDLESFHSVVGLLGTAVKPVAPPSGLRRRLLDRIAPPPAGPQLTAQPAGLPAGLAALARANDMPWKPTPFAGIRSKRLFTNSSDGTTVWLVNMAPGSFYPPHHHTAIEHTFVVEGDIVFDGYSLSAGEYQAALPDSDHDKPITTRNGCTVLIINNAHDEVFAGGGGHH